MATSLGASLIQRVSLEQRGAALIGALAAAAYAAGVSLCPFATLTGVPCPGCGLLRAMLALLGGHVGESLHLHPLAPVAFPLAAVAVLRLRSGNRSEAWITGSLAVLVVAMVLVWGARFGGALGGPVSVRSIWSAAGTTGPFSRALRR